MSETEEYRRLVTVINNGERVYEELCRNCWAFGEMFRMVKDDPRFTDSEKEKLKSEHELMKADMDDVKRKLDILKKREEKLIESLWPIPHLKVKEART